LHITISYIGCIVVVRGDRFLGTITYLLLDILDTSAIIFLMLSVFNYPLREYLKEYAISAITVAISSLIIRVYCDLPLIDTLAHFFIIVLCMRFLMRIRLYRAAHIAIVGVAGYFLIQLLVVGLLQLLQLIALHDMTLNSGFGVYLVQIVSDTLTLLISYLINRFGLGATKYIRPPHNFYINDAMSRNKLTNIIATCCALALVNVGFYIYQSQGLYPAIAILLIVSAFLVFLAYRRDKKRGNSSGYGAASSQGD
jgi:hypothetical protein